MVVGKIAIDLAEQLGHVTAQRAENRRRRRSRDAIAGVNDDFHRPRQCDPADDTGGVVGLHIRLADRAGRGGCHRCFGLHELAKRLNVVAIDRPATQHHLEAVVILGVVAACDLNA